MSKNTIRFITEVIKPWEKLNRELTVPYAIDPEISDLSSIGYSLSVSIKHLPESICNHRPKDLIQESLDYNIISDLADSSKHGDLRNPERNCSLSVASLFERNEDGLVRFLRNKIYLEHKVHGMVDFMDLAIKAAHFISRKIDVKTDWNPKIINNNGPFSDEIKVHASKNNQINFSALKLHFVQKNKNGEFEYVDLNSSVTITLTSDMNTHNNK